MKRIPLLIVLVLGASLLALSGSSVSSRGQKRGERSPNPQPALAQPSESTDSNQQNKTLTKRQQAGRAEEPEESEDDPDLPPGTSAINKEAYLKRREQYVGLRRGFEAGRPFDPAARGRAIEQMQAQEMLVAAKAKLNRAQSTRGFFGLSPSVVPVWTAIGPAPLPNGPYTGRVSCVVVDPTDSNKVYLGTAQGGVWRSLDGGVNWVSIFDNAASQAVGSLALAPSNPTILYVGTGETNRSGDSYFGVGLYRIDNADTSATLVGPINPAFSFNNGSGTVNTTTFAGRSISKIIVHPAQPGTIFVSTSSGVAGNGGNSLGGSTPPLALLGVYRSSNADGPMASITFQKLAVATLGGSLDVPGTGNRRVTDMVMEPGNPDNLVIGVSGNVGTNDGGIFRTTNALTSASFTQVLNIAATRIQFGINKDISSGVVKVVAATSETPSAASCPAFATQQGVLRQSVDGGATWPSSDANPTTGGILTDAGGFCGGQCFYNVTVAIDPNNANSIYLGGQAPSTCNGLMLRSSNGVTFSNDNNGLHADSHALYFDPLTIPSTVFTGNDGGVWKRSADAPVGTFWTNLNHAPLNTLQFEGLAVHPTDRNITIGGTQDNGTELQQTTSGAWLNSQGGDGGYTLIDQSATDTTNVTMYHTFYFDGSGGSGSQIKFERVTTLSAAASRQWTSLGCTAGVSANGISCSASVLFYAPMALGPGNPNTVYLGTDRLYRSTDRGTNNVTVSQQPISGSPVSTIAISPQDDNYRIVGMQNGEVWATSTGSATLVNITGGSFPANPSGSITNKFVGRAMVDPNNKDVAYITFSFFAQAGRGVWKITNLGAAAGSSPVAPNWSAAGNGIPSIPINAFAIDPTNSNNLFAGTDIGVYNSIDGGANWSPYGIGLPRSAVFDIAIQPTNRILRVATHGRGIWETDVVTAAGPNTAEFSSTSVTLTETLDQTIEFDLTVTRTGDTSGAATIDYASADGTASERSDYMAARGTLFFSGGETTKTIPIFIVDDRFGEAPETFTVSLSNPIGCSLGSQTTFTVTINSNEAVNGTNPVKDASFNNDFFVRQHYLDFFSRIPDAGGLAFWKNQLNECENVPLPGGFTTAQQCRETRRINVSAAFFLSIEFQETGYLVERLYKTAYGTATGNSTLGGAHTLPVPIVRLNEFLPDTQQIGRGVVIGQPGADLVLETNKQTLIAQFVQRQRFLTSFPLSMTSAQFVDALNTNAGGALSQSERDQLVTDLTAGTKTRAQVLRAVAEDSDLFNAEQNRAFVLAQFFGYLRRNPNDSPDSDYTGYDFWLGKLNQFNGNFVNAEMVKSFLVSGEYQQRFGP